MNKNFCTVLVALTLWKAVLVLFVATDDAPVRMLFIGFPQLHKTEAACERFIKDNNSKVTTTIKKLNLEGASILNSSLYCSADGSGVAT